MNTMSLNDRSRQWRDLAAMTLKEMREEHQQLVGILEQGKRSLTVFQVDDPEVTARIGALVTAMNQRYYTLLDGTIWQRTKPMGYEVPPVALMTEEALLDEEHRLLCLTTFGQGYPEFEEMRKRDRHSGPRLLEVQQELMQRKEARRIGGGGASTEADH